jgi:hypothetical protein
MSPTPPVRLAKPAKSSSGNASSAPVRLAIAAFSDKSGRVREGAHTLHFARCECPAYRTIQAAQLLEVSSARRTHPPMQSPEDARTSGVRACPPPELRAAQHGRLKVNVGRR